MGAPAWFAPTATERHTIVFPGAFERAAAMRTAGQSDEQVDAFLAEHTCWVEVRTLSAGDRAMLDELRFSDDGEGRISIGEQKIRAVELCLVAWSLELPLQSENVRALNATVLDEIFAAIPDGRLDPGVSGGANGSGPPPKAAEPPASVKDTAAQP